MGGRVDTVVSQKWGIRFQLFAEVGTLSLINLAKKPILLIIGA